MFVTQQSAIVSALRQSSPILLGDVSSSPISFDSLSNEGSLLNISVGTVGGAFSGTICK